MEDCLREADLSKIIKGAISTVDDEMVKHLCGCDACLEKCTVLFEYDNSKSRNFLAEEDNILKRILEAQKQRSVDATDVLSDTDVAQMDEIREAFEGKSAGDLATEITNIPDELFSPSPRAAPRAETVHPMRSRKRKKDFSAYIALVCIALVLVLGYVFYKQLGDMGRMDEIADQTQALSGDDQRTAALVEKQVAILVTVKGNIKLKEKKDDPFRAAIQDSFLYENAEIAVEQGGFGCISYIRSGVLVWFDENTSVTIGTLKLAENPKRASLTVKDGRIFAVIPQDAGYNDFRIRSGIDIVWGPGSEVCISFEGGKTLLASAKGTVKYKMGSGLKMTLGGKKSQVIGIGEEKELEGGLFTWLHEYGVRFALSTKKETTHKRREKSVLTKEGVTFKEDFDGVRLDNWKILGRGAWLIQRKGMLSHTSEEKRGMLILKEHYVSHFQIVTYFKCSGSGAVGVVFGYFPQEYHFFKWTADGMYEIYRVKGGIEKKVSSKPGDTPEPGKGYGIIVEYRGNSVEVHIGDKRVLFYVVGQLRRGRVGLLVENDPEVTFDSFLLRELIEEARY